MYTVSYLPTGLPSLAISVFMAVIIGLVFTLPDATMTAETFPWSILTFGLGSLLAVIAAIMVLVVSCCWGKYGEYRESEKDSITGSDGPGHHTDMQMSGMSKSYDRTRAPSRDGYRNGYDRAYDGGFSKSKKYRDPYDDRPRDGRNPRDYDRSIDRSYRNQGYDAYEQQGYGQEKGYGGGNSYGASRQDNMYRPYAQYRY